MKVYNFKVNKNLILKAFLFICMAVCVMFFFYAGYKLFYEMKKIKEQETEFVVNDSYFSENGVFEIQSNQYTNVLKEVHENINNFVGKKLSFVGYVYKIDYLPKNQFVLARNMIINSASQSVVVGFLSEYDEIDKFDNYSWVKVNATIQKGYLDGEIPILKVDSIEKAEKPSEEFVYPPDDTYVPTSATF